MTNLLSCEQVSKFFGGVKAVRDVSIEVRAGEIVSLIGPNGAGKTTLFNVITGMYEPTEGRVFLAGEGVTHDITGEPSHRVAEHGISHVSEHSPLQSTPGY